MKSVLQGVWGTPHQAKGGDSSESPPGVFWLQKTLLATFVGNLTLLGESFVPCLHAEAKTSKGNELLQGLFHKACAKIDHSQFTFLMLHTQNPFTKKSRDRLTADKASAAHLQLRASLAFD